MEQKLDTANAVVLPPPPSPTLPAPVKSNGGGPAGPGEVRQIVSKHVKDWDRILCVLNRGHWNAARYYEGWDVLLRNLAFITGFIAGSGAFVQLSDYAANEKGKIWLQVFVGVFALFSGLLGAAQSKFDFAKRVEIHQNAGQKFGMLRREFDEIQEIGFSSLELEEAGLKAFRTKWDAVEAEFPPVPEKSMKKAKKKGAE